MEACYPNKKKIILTFSHNSDSFFFMQLRVYNSKFKLYIYNKKVRIVSCNL